MNGYLLSHNCNPESMRMVPGFVLLAVTPFPAIRRSADVFHKTPFFRKHRSRAKTWLEIKCFLGAWGNVWAPDFFLFFRIFSLAQHSLNVVLRAPGSDLWNPGFPFLLGVGIRAPDSEIRRLGAGIQSLESGVAAFGSPTRPSISTYSRSTAPAAVMLHSVLRNEN